MAPALPKSWPDVEPNVTNGKSWTDHTANLMPLNTVDTLNKLYTIEQLRATFEVPELVCRQLNAKNTGGIAQSDSVVETDWCCWIT